MNISYIDLDRWSLIARRLPRRTANDVKNYWNTHLNKKPLISDHKYVKENGRRTEPVNIIRPRPWIFSKKLAWLKGKTTTDSKEDNLCKPSTTILDLQENETLWWESLLAGKVSDQGASGSMEWSDGDAITNLWAEKSLPGTPKVEDSIFIEVGQNCPSDYSFDVNLWNLFDREEERFN